MSSNQQFKRYWVEGDLRDWDTREIVVGKSASDYAGPLVRLDEVMAYLKSSSVETTASLPAPMPTVEELCDALHRKEEGSECHPIPARDLLAITSLLQSHPEWWDYPCFCAECRSYAHD